MGRRLQPYMIEAATLCDGGCSPTLLAQALFFGTKHWLLTPPRHAGVSGTKSDEWEARPLRAPCPCACTCAYKCICACPCMYP